MECVVRCTHFPVGGRNAIKERYCKSIKLWLLVHMDASPYLRGAVVPAVPIIPVAPVVPVLIGISGSLVPRWRKVTCFAWRIWVLSLVPSDPWYRLQGCNAVSYGRCSHGKNVLPLSSTSSSTFLWNVSELLLLPDYNSSHPSRWYSSSRLFIVNVGRSCKLLLSSA